MAGQKSPSPIAVETPASDIRLTLPALPENVAVVRHVIGALSDALELPDVLIEDIRLALSEACTNVVRHAYADGEGTIDVLVRSGGSVFEITVIDAGRGLGASPDTAGPGLGLPLIAALTDDFRVERSEGAGSRLTMSFARSRCTHALGRVA